MANIVFLILHL